ncbi:MAG: RNA-binding protein [Deltaproteobacteria bacterium]|nr:RNA-binding protein [Deltaproteobacteria bacterium]
MAKKLYVGNLNYEVTEDELSQLFSQCGQVSGARIVKDKFSGRSKGFGFVEMPNDDEATHAIDRMKGFDLKGRPITVDEAKERPEGLGGGGGRRFGGGGRDGGGGGGGGRRFGGGGRDGGGGGGGGGRRFGGGGRDGGGGGGDGGRRFGGGGRDGGGRDGYRGGRGGEDRDRDRDRDRGYKGGDDGGYDDEGSGNY